MKLKLKNILKTKIFILCFACLLVSCEKVEPKDPRCNETCIEFDLTNVKFEISNATLIRNSKEDYFLNSTAKPGCIMKCDFEFDQKTKKYNISTDLAFNCGYGVGFPRIKYIDSGYIEFLLEEVVVTDLVCNLSHYYGSVKTFDLNYVEKSDLDFSTLCPLYNNFFSFYIVMNEDTVRTSFILREK